MARGLCLDPIFSTVDESDLYHFLDEAKQDESDAEDRLRALVQQRVQNQTKPN